jgi:hypothetical protein
VGKIVIFHFKETSILLLFQGLKKVLIYESFIEKMGVIGALTGLARFLSFWDRQIALIFCLDFPVPEEYFLLSVVTPCSQINPTTQPLTF